MTSKAIAICGLIIAALVALAGAAATVWTLGNGAGEIRQEVAALREHARNTQTDVKAIATAVATLTVDVAEIKVATSLPRKPGAPTAAAVPVAP